MCTLAMHTAADFDIQIIQTVLSAPDIAILFDNQLNYVALNDNACRHFDRKKEELLGRCVLDIYPDIIASANHRNMLRALDGEAILNCRVTGRTGILFNISYIPVFPEGSVKGILLNAQKIETAA
jgi:PAS domain-containing protein